MPRLSPARPSAIRLDPLRACWGRIRKRELDNPYRLAPPVPHAHDDDLLTRWQGVPPDEATELLEVYGVRRKPGLIQCAGAAELRVGNKTYAPEDFTPAAHLPDAWAEACVDAVVSSGGRCVTTIENEYPFLSYVEQAGGAAGLASRGEIAVYTAGFPAPRLVNALAGLAQSSTAVFQHWGDADVGGLRIWYFLRSRLGCPLMPVRTTADWVARESAHGGRALSAMERQALHRMREELDQADGLDFDAARAVIDALLEGGMKLEQERW